MYQTTKKRASGPKCPVTGKRIQGVCMIFIELSLMAFWILHDLKCYIVLLVPSLIRFS